MQRLFGTGKPGPAKATISDCIAKNDARTETVDSHVRRIDAELYKLKEQMSRMREGPAKNALRQRAMKQLRMKKAYEGQRDQLAQQAFNMIQTEMATETLKDTVAVVDAMSSAARDMKKAYKQTNIAKIERIQDNLDDMMLDANDIQEILGRPMMASGAADVLDDADLEAELEALTAELDFETPGALGQHQEQSPAPAGAAAAAPASDTDDLLRMQLEGIAAPPNNSSSSSSTLPKPSDQQLDAAALAAPANQR